MTGPGEERIEKCIGRLVMIVEKIVRFLSGQLETSQFIAVTVFKGMKVLEEEMIDLEEGAIADFNQETIAPGDVMTGLEEGMIEKCLGQHVMIVEKIVRFLLSQLGISQFIVVGVLKREILQVLTKEILFLEGNLINLGRSTMKLMQSSTKSYLFCKKWTLHLMR